MISATRKLEKITPKESNDITCYNTLTLEQMFITRFRSCFSFVKSVLLLVALALAYLFSSPLLAGREGSGRRLALYTLLLFLFKRVQTRMQIFYFLHIVTQ